MGCGDGTSMTGFEISNFLLARKGQAEAAFPTSSGGHRLKTLIDGRAPLLDEETLLFLRLPDAAVGNILSQRPTTGVGKISSYIIQSHQTQWTSETAKTKGKGTGLWRKGSTTQRAPALF